MSYEIPGFSRSYEAVGDLSGSYLKFVKLTGANIVGAVAAATDHAVGVLQNKPNAAGTGVFLGPQNSSATVMVFGVTRVVAGAAVNAGDPLVINATGEVVPAVAGATANTQPVVGIAESAAAAAGDTLSMLLKPLGSVIV